MERQWENTKPSGLKPPSRLPAMSSTSNTRALLETSQSDINAKNAGMMLPPPSTMGASMKHKIPGLPEPPTKRKTLVERAGESMNPLRSHMPQSKSSLNSSDNLYQTNGAGRSQSHMGGILSTTSYRNTSNASTVSSASSASSNRPSSRQHGARNVTGQPPSASGSRAAVEDDDAEAGITNKRKAWDTKGRLEDMESLYSTLRVQLVSAADSKNALEESMALYKARVQELSQENRDLSSSNKNISSDLERARRDLHTTSTDLQQARRDHVRDAQDADRKHERDLTDLYAKQEQESRRLELELEKIAEQNERDVAEAKRAWEKQKDVETADLTTQHWEEIEELKTGHLQEAVRLQGEIEKLKQAGESRASESAGEVQELRNLVAEMQALVETSKATEKALRTQLSALEGRIAALEQEKAALISKTHFLEGNQEAQSHEFTTMREESEAARADAKEVREQLRREEMARRKLNAQILELKGNIRVFARTRPLLKDEEEPSKVDFPDTDDLDGGKEMIVFGPRQLTVTGKERIEKHNYSFDRVFAPATPNQQVFDECRELIQSVVDGYNVSILSYGQTGSGKTYGMSGPDGIIPCSISLLLSEMQRLKEKGWEYAVEASFVEVYNETLNDLLGDAKTWDDANGEDLNSSVRGKRKEKHEIHHDAVTGKTTVSNLSSVSLWPPPADDGAWPPPAPDTATDSSPSTQPTSYTEKAVASLLTTAAKNRRVAATKSNERSSRSHSIFILTLRGSCAATSESSEGVLNLVDLAGSERLKASGAEGSRMKETQAINKSLSSLGDVIAALGNRRETSGGGDAHVPYRNSKLTYLLQSSLGGTAANGKSSRTLMLLHLSPLAAHWQESRSSLLFGGKVGGAHIGNAKKR